VREVVIALPRSSLTTADAVLHPNRVEFAADLCAAAAESIGTVGRWMTWCRSGVAQAEAVEWYRRCERNWDDGSEYEFSLFSRSGQFLGAAGLNQFNATHNLANLGYWIRESQQRRGLATQAARALAGFGLETLKLNRIEIVAAEGNVASRGVAEKIGAKFEGVLRNRLMIHGMAHDAAMYSLIGDTDRVLAPRVDGAHDRSRGSRNSRR
jgi:ribosomal-protein-serine acetyltransferase